MPTRDPVQHAEIHLKVDERLTALEERLETAERLAMRVPAIEARIGRSERLVMEVQGEVRKLSKMVTEEHQNFNRKLDQILAQGSQQPTEVRPSAILGPADPALDPYRAVVEGLPVVQWVVGADHRFTHSVGRGLAALGLREAEVVGRSIYEVYSAHKEILADYARALVGESFTSTVIIGPIAVECHWAPLRDEAGVIKGVIGLAFDVTGQVDLGDPPLDVVDTGVPKTPPPPASAPPPAPPPSRPGPPIPEPVFFPLPKPSSP